MVLWHHSRNFVKPTSSPCFSSTPAAYSLSSNCNTLLNGVTLESMRRRLLAAFLLRKDFVAVACFAKFPVASTGQRHHSSSKNNTIAKRPIAMMATSSLCLLQAVEGRQSLNQH